MGPQHAVVGDSAFFDMPQSRVASKDLSREAAMARFSKSAEFQTLKDNMEQRIEYYRRYQPGGSGGDMALRDMPNDERGWRTLAADLVITEFQAVLTAYELAAEAVKDNATTRRKAA